MVLGVLIIYGIALVGMVATALLIAALLGGWLPGH